MRRLLIAVSFLITGAIVGGATLAVWAKARFEAPGPSDQRVTVAVPPGASLERVAHKLARKKVIRSPWLFRAGAYVTGTAGELKAGEFAFPPGVSARKALAVIVGGETVTYSITVPEGETSAEVVARLRGHEALAGTISPVPREGSLLPDTYRFERGHTRTRLINRMQQAAEDFLDKVWPKRAGDLPYDTRREAITLASIVEKETAVADERAVIAGVFVNRLREGMRLQSDPTVRYAVTDGERVLDRPLRESDLARDDPYNTYTNAGLPPGPIANPSRAAIRAALNPADTPYRYFVADPDGEGHAFARTLEEHNANVAAWRERDQAD